MINHAFLISIRPRFAEMIFAGSKTVELRRVCPKVSAGDLALVYVSSPAMELRGSFEVGKILTASQSGGLLRLHAAVNKNRKEQSLPLHQELAMALQQQKPANCKANDLVLVNGVPKMKEFRQDLKKAGIPFLDERGHRMDYHALRTTFITRLSTMKVHPRLAMELARHSDMRLTMKTYTDAGQLPLRANFLSRASSSRSFVTAAGFRSRRKF